jgi:pimeloyl-ACP methyl ester carboxylesterase
LDVAALRVPVLTIHGTKDRNAPYGAGKEWAEALPSARLLTAEGAAHQAWVDRPELLVAIREFLAAR